MSRIRDPPASHRGKAGAEFACGETFAEVKGNPPSQVNLGVAQMDIILSLTGIAFFALMLGYVKICEQL